jgi:hypothetical protein
MPEFIPVVLSILILLAVVAGMSVVGLELIRTTWGICRERMKR